MRFGSVCSGIEAASVAWKPLGWEAAWFSEIEPFPSAVLAHHYPTVPNHGDMMTLPERILAGEIEAPDLLCGGTPCQAFSVAGLRRSLDDARGNLSLTFCELADAIDIVRSTRGDAPAIIVWENVPGVLTTKDNAFGCFLGQLAGEDEAIEVDRWPRAGLVDGRRRRVAWATLDAQFFGLAQRRRRVFVLAVAQETIRRFGDRVDPAAILSIGSCLRGNTPSRGQAWQGAAAGAASSAGVGSICARTGLSVSVQDAASGHLLPEVAPTLDQRAGRSGETTFATSGGLVAEVVGRTMLGHDVFPCLDRTSYEKGWCNQAIQQGLGVFCMSSGQANAGIARDRASTLNCLHEAPVVAHALRVEGFDASEDGTGRGTPIVPVHAFEARQSDVLQYGDKIGPLDTDGHSVAVLAFDSTQVTSPTNRSNPQPGDPCHSLAAGARAPSIATSMAVRRLTPRECERLQGFPDDYTAIPWRSKSAEDCPDGPRYKALGNSWAVPVVRWIGRRIAEAL